MSTDVRTNGTGTALGSRLRDRFGRPTVGPGAAARAVAEDASALVRAEIELAKAEAGAAAREKAAGAALAAAGATFGFLALQALLVTLGLVLALVLPGWAAAGVVALALLALTGGLLAVAKRRLSRPVRMQATKETLEEDAEWARTRLRR